MDSARWERIQAVFHEAIALPPGERRGYVESTAGDDHELIAEVLAALEEDEHGSSLLDAGVGRLAAPLLDGAQSALEQIGPYRFVRVLGEGGMGTVYGARGEKLHRAVALKPFSSVEEDGRGGQRFWRAATHW